MDRKWFVEPDHKASIFRPVDKLLDNREEWALALVNSVDPPLDARIAGEDLAERYSWTKQDLLAQVGELKDDRTSNLDTTAHEAMIEANSSRLRWRIERKASTTRKASAMFQKSMNDFSVFLEGFSGIVTIAQAADQQYGGLAYGTLSLFLSVFVHKTQREQALDEGFEELSVAFPRLMILQGLDRNSTPDSCRAFKQLESLIACTFGLVLKYGREATQYYKKKTQRYKEVFLPMDRNNKTLMDIRRALDEIRHEVDILQLTKIHSLERKMDKMSLQLKETHRSVVGTAHLMERARRSADITHLADLRRILDVQERSLHTDLPACRKLLTLAFSDANVQSKYYHPKRISMELLKSDEDFCNWWESASSSLLFAGGSNMEDVVSIRGTLNWLSLGAVLVIEELRNENKNVAFFLAQTTETVSYRTRCPIRRIMSMLLYQIAQMHEDFLRSEVDTLEAAAQSPAWKQGSVDVFMEVMHDILTRILSCFSPDDQIHIVIDRLDQCAWGEDDEEDDQMRLAIEWLLRVAAEACCCLKILIVVEASSSRRLKKTQSILPKKARESLLLKADWCQEVEEGRQDPLMSMIA